MKMKEIHQKNQFILIFYKALRNPQIQINKKH